MQGASAFEDQAMPIQGSEIARAPNESAPATASARFRWAFSHPLTTGRREVSAKLGPSAGYRRHHRFGTDTGSSSNITRPTQHHQRRRAPHPRQLKLPHHQTFGRAYRTVNQSDRQSAAFLAVSVKVGQLRVDKKRRDDVNVVESVDVDVVEFRAGHVGEVAPDQRVCGPG